MVISKIDQNPVLVLAEAGITVRLTFCGLFVI
jgi:hypothetical protein